MALLIGVVLALLVGVMATMVRLDRDRAFYPTVMLVIASLYLLFAVIGGSTQALALEAVPAAVFMAAAILGFRSSLWLVAAALAAHGIFDFFHAHAIDNPGVPPWWPQFCGAYDVAAALYLAWLLASGRLRARGVAGT